MHVYVVWCAVMLRARLSLTPHTFWLAAAAQSAHNFYHPRTKFTRNTERANGFTNQQKTRDSVFDRTVYARSSPQY